MRGARDDGVADAPLGKEVWERLVVDVGEDAASASLDDVSKVSHEVTALFSSPRAHSQGTSSKFTHKTFCNLSNLTSCFARGSRAPQEKPSKTASQHRRSAWPIAQWKESWRCGFCERSDAGSWKPAVSLGRQRARQGKASPSRPLWHRGLSQLWHRHRNGYSPLRVLRNRSAVCFPRRTTLQSND